MYVHLISALQRHVGEALAATGLIAAKAPPTEIAITMESRV